MSEMYDPNNPAHNGPQVTARPGTKRHAAQVRARAVFFAIRHVTERGKLKRAEAALEAHYAKMLDILPPQGNA